MDLNSKIINEVANKFYQMDKEVKDMLKKNVKAGLEKSNQNYIIKMQICRDLVGIEKENELFDLISEKATKIFYKNKKDINKFRLIKLNTSK